MTRGWEIGVRDPERIAALNKSGLVGTGPEDAFDRLTELAGALTCAPRVCITLVDAEHITYKSALGLPDTATSHALTEKSFCRFVVGTGRPLVVDDARYDPRTRDDPAIELYDAAAWAGYPIEGADGAILGTFCLMDSVPHEWTARDLHVLATLSKAASSEIALRQTQNDLVTARQETAALRLSAQRDRGALEAHLHAISLPDAPEAHFARALLVWLDAGRFA